MFGFFTLDLGKIVVRVFDAKLEEKWSNLVISKYFFRLNISERDRNSV